MDKLKEWFVNVGVQQMGPSAIRGSILGIIGWLVMKDNLIPGIHTDAATHITTIAWDTVSTWAIAGLPAVTAAVIKLLNYHGAQAVNQIKGETPK